MSGDAEDLVRTLDPANVIVHEAQGAILHWASGCERLYGWSREEAIGRIVYDLLETKFPRPLKEILAELHKSGSWQGELENCKKDGSTIPVSSLWVTPVSDDQSVRVILQTNNDLSELKRVRLCLEEREAHLRSVLDAVPDAVVVIDDAGLVTSFSAAATKLFGYGADEVLGRNVKLLMPSTYREEHDSYIGHYLKTGEMGVIGRSRILVGRRKDGTSFPMEIAIGEARLAGRRIFTGFIRDLTSRQKIEEELRQSQKMEAIGQLSGGIAHDFNNLLTVIIGNLELLQPSLKSSTQRELVKEAQAAAEDGATLTAQLLAFGRRQPLNPKLVDIGPLVSNFSDLLRRTLGEAVKFRIIVTGSPNQAVVDAAQLQSALLNLVINARDAMSNNGALTIEISRTQIDADYAQAYPEVGIGPYTLISVTDTGAGMSAEMRERAFEPFFTTKSGGTGLGLPMVYGFVKQSGGHIQIYSELGRGTSIRIFLPRAESTLPSEEPTTHAIEPAAMPGGSETILVVEDDDRVRRVVVTRLKGLGYQVIEADSGNEGLVILSKHPEIRMVFTDVVMPGGMSGTALAKAALALRPDLKVLFTSGFAAPEVAGLGLEAGVWLKKPYSASELAHKLRQVFSAPSS